MAQTSVYSFVPGTLATDTAFGIPADAPDLYLLTSAYYTVGASGGTASTTSPTSLTVATGDGAPSASPASGHIYYDRQNRQVYLGTAATDGWVITMRGGLRGAMSVLS